MTLLSTDAVDWKLDATGHMAFPLELVRGADGVAQRIKIKMKLFRGELFTNALAGMPWLEGEGVDPNVVILGNPFVEALAKSEARKIIEAVDGAGEIVEMIAAFDPSIRKMRLTFRVETEFDDVDGDPVVVSDSVEVDL